MIIVFAILAATRAYPVGQSSPPNLAESLHQFQARAPLCDDPQGCRSLWDIIWSCTVTILLCSWASVHPNIPSPDDRRTKVVVRRIGLMLLTLFVPEAMIAWALKQRLAAAELAKIHKGEGWTITHGFFAIMGGFMEYEGNRPIRVLLPEQLVSYSLTGNGDFPRIAKEEIEDKSKGDVISKSLVILQTGWFVTQCIVRGARGLPVTELELVTVAFATLNFVMYLLWWDKPLNVERGVRVYKKRITEEPVDDGDVSTISSFGFWAYLLGALSEIRAVVIRGPVAGVNASWLSRVAAWPVLKPLQIFLGDFDGNLEKRVSTFYPPIWINGRGPLARVMIAAIASAFGGIHCIAWSFTFPSTTEQRLWYHASVVIITVPVVVLFMFVIGISDPSNTTIVFILLCLSFLYLLGRLALLILPVLSLRSLPPAAYHVVHWASLIPHL
ncbi:hypothetical protein F5148DRAFT_1373939 [Russula earlei]|uniref:Uncharacterized protein n=1 Tax=Russula earlei TaxID=71964 RepID=A0ACC0UHT8_9AGAM|nr:hypothetical protein F5148DRAFT_1373939 [Russula earlei]